jgi:hypothetical protein
MQGSDSEDSDVEGDISPEESGSEREQSSGDKAGCEQEADELGHLPSPNPHPGEGMASQQAQQHGRQPCGRGRQSLPPIAEDAPQQLVQEPRQVLRSMQAGSLPETSEEGSQQQEMGQSQSSADQGSSGNQHRLPSLAMLRWDELEEPSRNRRLVSPRLRPVLSWPLCVAVHSVLGGPNCLGEKVFPLFLQASTYISAACSCPCLHGLARGLGRAGQEL